MKPQTREEMQRLVEERKPQTPEEPARVRGLGDVVAKATKAVGIQPCAPCERRRNWLNKYFPAPK